MSPETFVWLAWVLVLTLSGALVSWFVLIMQAFFDDKRIALASVVGGALAALTMAFSEKLSHSILIVVLIVNLGLIVWFAFRQIRKPVVYLSLITLLICSAILFGMWWHFQGA